MRRNAIAEGILALLTERERAACIVGDLAETAETRGAAFFWRSVASTAFGLGWRFAAMFVVCIAMQVGTTALVGSIMNRTGKPAPLGMVLSFSGALLSGIALYAALRYGVRDAMTRLAAAIAAVALVGGYFQRTPFVPQLALATALALMIASVIRRRGRRAAAVTFATYGASAITFFAVVMINNIGSSPRTVALPFPLNYSLVIAAQWLVCSRMRRVETT